MASNHGIEGINKACSTQKETERKQDYIIFGTVQSYSNQTQPRVIVQPNITEHVADDINNEILPQIQQSLLEENREDNITANCFYADNRNQTNKSDCEEDLLSTHALSNSAGFLSPETKSHTFVYGSVNAACPGDSLRAAGTDVQEMSSYPKGDHSNMGTDTKKFENCVTLVNYDNCILSTIQPLPNVLQNSIQYATNAKVSNESFSDVGRKAVKERVQISMGNSDCELFNSIEPVTDIVDVLEETVVTTENEHFCTDKAGNLIIPFTCGPCQTIFNSICKLHDHFQSKHETGSYVYYCNSRVAFPRFEVACKNTQTDIHEFVENDYGRFKDGEIDELDDVEEDFENGLDIVEGVSTSECIDNVSGRENDHVKDLVDVSLRKEEKVSGYIREEFSEEKGKRRCRDDTDMESDDFEKQIKDGNDISSKLECNTSKKKKKKDEEKKETRKRVKKEGRPHVSVISINNSGIRLKVCANGINVPKLKESKQTKYTRTRSRAKNSDSLNKLECMNQSEKIKDVAIDRSIVESVNQPDQTVENTIPANEGAEQSIIEENINSQNDSISFCLEKQRNFSGKLKRKVKEKKASRNASVKESSYSCSICATSFSSKVKLKYHMSKSHRLISEENAEGQRTCRWCGLTFPESESFSVHIRHCDKNERLICLICSRKFNTRQEVTDHINTHESVDELKCRLCEKMFASVVALQRHLRGHNRPKNLQCEHCGRAFYFFNLLKKHKAYCNREPDVDCSHCDLKFKTAEALKHHMSVHSNERPFVCHICGYAG